MVSETEFAVASIVKAECYDHSVGDDWGKLGLFSSLVSTQLSCRCKEERTVEVMLPPSKFPIKLFMLLYLLPTTLP